MSIIYLINHNEDLIQALESYKKLLLWPHEWRVHPNPDLSPIEPGSILLVYNAEPEKLDGIRAAQNLRHNPQTFGIPILFLSEKLSEYGQLLMNDLDFIWHSEQPFHSKHFFETIQKIQTYASAHESFLHQVNDTYTAVTEGKFSEASKSLKLIGDRFKSSLRYSIWVAQIHLGLKDYDRALKACLSAQKLKPTSLEVANLLASIYFKRGDTANYNLIMEKTLRIAEIHLQNLLHWGDVYLEQGHARKSVTAFEAALAKDPKNQRARQGILATNLVEGKTILAGSADLAGNQSLEIARMFNLKGISMAEAGQYRTAERLYSNAIKILPNQDIAYKLWLNLGLCMKKKGDLIAALEYFQKCQESAPPEYKRAAAQIQELKDDIRKEADQGDLSHIKERIIRPAKTLDYKKIQP